MVIIMPPPPVVAPNPVWFTAPRGSKFVRMFDPTSYDATAISFRSHGPHKRFDHHTDNASGPELDPHRGILYAGATLSGCLVEIFGDTRIIQYASWQLSGFEIERELMLLDLRGDGAMRAGSVAALCKDSDHSLSQKWSRYFYETLFIYKQLDGLIFGNAHNDELALALYERSRSALKVISSIPLSHSSLKQTLQKTAGELGFSIEPQNSK